jgi:hypothetical protein
MARINAAIPAIHADVFADSMYHPARWRGTFAVLDRAGHGLAIEQRGVLAKLAEEWLDRVAEASAPMPG